MLSEISIRNVVLIETLDLELGAGLIAMTGETGAGKSIILDALGMATGARSDKTLVRSGADKAVCTARFSLADNHKVRALLKDADIEIDGRDDLVLRRSIAIDGRSRAYINDNPTGQKLLAEIGALVLEVHGQHDGRGLLDATTHRGLLDTFGSLQSVVDSCAQSYENLKIAQSHVGDLVERQGKSDADKEYIEHAIAELDRLAPAAGEDESLASERRVLQHAEGAVSELTHAQQALRGEGEYEARIGQALAGLERVRVKIGGESDNPNIAALQKATTALEKALIEIDEARSAVDNAAHVFTFEPGRLDTIEQRLFALRACARKYDVDVNGLALLRQNFGDELLALSQFSENLEAAEVNLAMAKKNYDKIANTLTKARIKAAKRLDNNVMAELPPLKMQHARFQTVVGQGEPTAHGQDKIIFEISTNPGTPFGPLGKIASGGELSRFSLAIKVALVGRSADKNGKVMVFDEVDAGVGGAVADAVGKRLSALAAQEQVLVVTHSPQVAACADHQLLIHKTTKNAQTITSVDVLNAEERAEEIARMLAGQSVSEEARAAARQLMQGT